MKQLTTIIISSAFLLISGISTASAEQARPYISLVGGLNLADEMTLTDNAGDYFVDFDPGFFAGGAIGYDLGDSYPQIGKGRLEVELAYRYNEMTEAKFANGAFPAAGELSAVSLMFNAVGEYRELSSRYLPYFGVGLGAAFVTISQSYVSGSPLIDDDSIQFAYQVMTGFNFPLGKKLSFDVGYRYFGTTETEFTDAKNRKVETNLGNHSAEIGLRLKF